MSQIVLTLMTRHGCCLCRDMEAVVRTVGPEFSVRIDAVSIDGNPELEARYGQMVPLVMVNGRRAFKYRVTPVELRRRLRAERRRAASPWRRLVAMLR